MEFRRLNYFYVLANFKNFTKASESLHITQPTLSQQISELEKNLGIVLFDRNNRKIELTPAGIRLYKEVHQLMEQYNRCIAVADFFKEGTSGTLKIGTLDLLEPTFFSEFIFDFSNKYPDINIDIVNTTYHNMPQMVDDFTLDFALDLVPSVPHSQNVELININYDRLVIGVPETSEFAEIGSISDTRIFDLLSHPGCLFEGWHNHPEPLMYLKTINPDTKFSYYSSSSTMLLKVIENNSFTVLPEFFLSYLCINFYPSFHVIPLGEPHCNLHLSVVYSRRNPNPCIQTLANALREYINSHEIAQPEPAAKP